MGSSRDRFRGLDEPAAPQDTADLFEHFGVEVARQTQTHDVVAVDAGLCRRCGWLLAVADADRSCPVCAQERPLDPPKT